MLEQPPIRKRARRTDSARTCSSRFFLRLLLNSKVLQIRVMHIHRQSRNLRVSPKRPVACVLLMYFYDVCAARRLRAPTGAPASCPLGGSSWNLACSSACAGRRRARLRIFRAPGVAWGSDSRRVPSRP